MMATPLWAGWLLAYCIVLKCDVGMLDAFCKDWVRVDRPSGRLEGFGARQRWMDACAGEMVVVVRSSCFCATARCTWIEELSNKWLR